MKQLTNDNAANRASYIGEVYNIGGKIVSKEILSSLPKKLADLHTEGYIHIHDLDAYGKTYNCLTFNWVDSFPYLNFCKLSTIGKIIRIFGYLKTLLADIGNEQSGGMAFANFDNDLAEVLSKLGVDDTKTTRDLLKEEIGDFILWCNNTHTRMGQTSYYITLNIGLAKSELARYIAYTVIDEFENIGDLVFKPNIVFKVKNGVNRFPNDNNYDLLKQALNCTSKKMIPTYLLCDCKEDRDIEPSELSIMGCRTRVVNDIFGESTAIGRGNIANISVNLPRLALDSLNESNPVEEFKKKWIEIAESTKDILIDRYNKVLSRKIDDFPSNQQRNLWCVPFLDIKDVFKHGTLSIGFIGLSEAFELLTEKKYYEDNATYKLALNFVEYMRKYCDSLTLKYNINFSLLATSGELISGRFVEIDKKKYEDKYEIFKKGFYTNSFHVNVDSGISARSKLRLEGPFHEYCNGGSISYVELNEAPIENVEGLDELLEEAINSNVRYFGINYPKDVCNNCNSSGVFDVCPHCGSKNITRIRRVSGYLEILDGFTNGKKNEVNNRKTN